MEKIQKQKYDVFISYRRSDSIKRAETIKDILIEKYDAKRIFMDKDHLHQGHFPQKLKEAIIDSHFFIWIISADSFSNNKDSLKTDFYYEEIRCAIENNKKIIPILYDGLKMDSIVFPKFLDDNKVQYINAILFDEFSHEEFKKEIFKFVVENNAWRKYIKMPLLLITIYLGVSIISGIGWYVHDNYFLDEDYMITTVADYSNQVENTLVYNLPNKLVSYDLNEPHNIKIHEYNTGNIHIEQSDVFEVGFFTVTIGLLYEIMGSSSKPHNGKTFIAYCCAIVAVALGVGFGATIERMLFPVQYSKQIRKRLKDQLFWNKVVQKKFYMQELEIE